MANLANDHKFAKISSNQILAVKKSHVIEVFKCATTMSILKYLKRVPVPIQDEGLPEPSSSLINVVPPKAIEMTNAEVVKVKNKAPRGSRSVPYLILTPAQRYEVGKIAAEHGITAALRYFTK